MTDDPVEALKLYLQYVNTLNSITLVQTMAVVGVEITRPNDSFAYGANDSVNTSTSVPTMITFAGLARIIGGTGYITNVRMIKSTATVTNANFRLWLYNQAITPVNDNAPFTLLYANAAKRLGYVDLVMTTEGTGSDSASCFLANVNMKFDTQANSTSIFGLLETKAAYAPGAQEKFYIELTADQN